VFKNTAGKFVVFAFDATTNVPKTGDAANLTAYVSKDDGSVTVLADTSATEMDATNAAGYYLFDAAQGETNADKLLITAKSTTANIKVIGAPAVIYTRPVAFGLVAGAAGGLFIAGTNAATTITTALTTTFTGSLTGSVASVTAGVTLAASAVQAIWDALTSALTTVGSIGKLLVDNINATISSRLATAGYTAPLDAAGVRTAVGLVSANLDTQLGAIDDFLDTEVAAILLYVDDLETRLSAALATVLQAHSLAVGRVVLAAGSDATHLVFSTVNGGAPSAVDDFYNGAVFVFTSGALALQRVSINDYVGATATATISAATGSAAAAVTGVIV
jgi:hypothetical protein